MKKISLTTGEYILVDDSDYAYLKKHTWYLRGGYAGRYITKNKERVLILMHRQILNTPKGMCSDHINGNRFDNRRENLRIVTFSQNQWNQVNRKIKGIDFRDYLKNKKWRARIETRGLKMHLGYFKTKNEAMSAYNNAAIKYRGEFAHLNEIK